MIKFVRSGICDITAPLLVAEETRALIILFLQCSVIWGCTSRYQPCGHSHRTEQDKPLL